MKLLQLMFWAYYNNDDDVVAADDDDDNIHINNTSNLRKKTQKTRNPNKKWLFATSVLKLIQK